MNPSFAAVDQLLRRCVPDRTPAAQLVVRWHGELQLQTAHGWFDPDQRARAIDLNTRFDLASLTKLFVTTALMRLVEAEKVALDQPVCQVLPEFTGQRPIRPYEDPLQTGGFVSVAATEERNGDTVDASAVTFRHLLTHSAGLPAWRPLFQQADAAAARQMACETFFSAPAGQQVVYSDIGLILLGLAVERLSDQPLAAAVTELVCQPLGLTRTGYLPIGHGACDPATIAPTEACRWRQRRVVAEVHDENAARLGGVAGHAGLFATATDVARFGQLFLDGGDPLLQPSTVDAMSREQVRDDQISRGLGFLRWSPEPTASSHPFGKRAFGHTGFTGTSLWIDPDRALVVALLTNEVYHGRHERQIAPLRVAIHEAVIAAVDQAD